MEIETIPSLVTEGVAAGHRFHGAITALAPAVAGLADLSRSAGEVSG